MYSELQCKTNFSFLRGASHPEELIQRAAELGLTAIALTDFDGVYGIPKAYWEKKKFPDLKLISGASVNIEGKRIEFLAKNRKGYGLLCRIITASHAGKEKGQASLLWKELEEFLQKPEATGLFALAPIEMDFAKIRPYFAKDQLFLTLTRYLDGRDPKRTEKAHWFSRRWQMPLVATNDVHYHLPARKRLQDALTSIRENIPLQTLGHKLYSNGERYLKSAEEMQKLFSDHPGAVENTLVISQQCHFCPSELRYRYPDEWIPEGKTSQSYLIELVWQGAAKRYGTIIPLAVKKQLDHEIDLIGKLQFADYFLTIYDIVEFARAKNILCQGRGSAANSAVCYVLGITAIDPVRMNLLFERFLSLERNEPPDIDVDFEHERREEVLQYVYQKYGRDRAAMVSAVVTYRRRSAFRELAKTLSVEVGTLSAKKLEKQFEEKAANSPAEEPRKLVEELSQEMAGFPRHLSIHSGGFTLSADPIIEIVPVEPARMEGRTIIQWDKYDLDFLGLLKVDLLCLGMLTAIHRTLQLVGKEITQIPAEDPATYAMIQRADTVGTFQIESRAQMSMLGRLQPRNFYDLVVEVAIVRPGPIVGKMVHPYLRRRRGQERVTYPHPKLKAILGKTLGVPLFQEQVMKMAIEVGGFSPGEADELRRAIGAWRSEGSIHKMGLKLIEGFRKSGLSQEYAEQVFQQIQGFAQYGFPESHAASFALIAYISCYLKCHYPAAFTCGLLNSQPMGFYAPHSLIDDAKLHGVEVLPVHPNHSLWDSQVVQGKLQLGWRVVHGIHREQAAQLVTARPFRNLEDFLRRTFLRKDALVRLAMGGTFQCFGFSPREALWQILEFHRKKEVVQGDLFLDLPRTPPPSEAKFSALSEFAQIREEYASFHLSTSGHPMSALRKMLSIPKLTTAAAKKLPNGKVLSIAGLILVRQKPPTAKGMTFSTLEDETGFLDMAIAPDIWEKIKTVFLENCFLEVKGKLQKEGNSTSLWVYDLRAIQFEIPEKRLHIEPTQYFW